MVATHHLKTFVIVSAPGKLVNIQEKYDGSNGASGMNGNDSLGVDLLTFALRHFPL